MYGTYSKHQFARYFDVVSHNFPGYIFSKLYLSANFLHDDLQIVLNPK